MNILDPMALWGREMSRAEMKALIEAANDLLNVAIRLLREDADGDYTIGLIEDARAAVAKAKRGTMAKAPKKSVIGWRYTTEHSGAWWTVEGRLEGFVTCENQQDAETIAEALNMATAARQIKRKAAALARDLNEVSQLFEEE